MKNRITMAVGALFLLPTYAFSAQYGSMMNGGNGGLWAVGSWLGGYVGISGLLLMVVAVAGLVVLIVRDRKIDPMFPFSHCKKGKISAKSFLHMVSIRGFLILHGSNDHRIKRDLRHS